MAFFPPRRGRSPAAPRWSRREYLKLSGFGLAGLLHPPLLAGCGGDRARSAPDSGASDSGAPDAGEFEPYEFDPNRPWWLQYNYAPVDEERFVEELEVEGTIPPELDGLYVRNGSNPKTGDAIHWFVGDGMLHGVRLSGGRARWYRNRYVQTAQLLGPPPPPGTLTPPTLEGNASNVSLALHAGKLLSLGEVGLPYAIDPADLGTLGAYDFEGSLATAMTAHPKIDAVTGELLMFGYGFSPPFLTYHRVDASGALVQSEPIELPSLSMMHDFQITATRVIFMDLPIVFDLQLAIDGIFPFRWDAARPARFGVMPRTGTNADVRWVEIPPCYIFHTLNAYDDPDDPGVVVLEAARHPRLWDETPNSFDATPTLYRYRIDPAAGTASQEELDDRLIEFPQLDRRLVGYKQRYGYGLWLNHGDGPQPAGSRGILKYDLDGGTVTAHELALYEHADEAIFVPASSAAGEDEGYLLAYVYDAREDRTSLVILDARDVESKPLARIKLPSRVPFGFHGVWVPAPSS